MINLPEKYKINIINRYNEQGKKWLDNIDEIIYKYIKNFGLTNISLINDLSMNIIFFATSKVYGEVVVKILTSKKSFISETSYIKQCNSKNIVKCYYSNLEDKAIILERIIPGENLTIVNDRTQRVKIFCDVLNSLVVEYDNKINTNNFMSFDNILDDKLLFIKDNKEYYRNILDLIEKAIILNNELKDMNLKVGILHNDLHHKNILKSENGWKVIDPIGIVGYKVIEILQFIRWELEIEKRDLSKLHEIINLVSNYTKYDILLIYKSLYVYSIDKLIFYIKSKFSKDTIIYNINLLKYIFNYIENANK